MKDTGLNSGLVQKFDTSDKRSLHTFYGFRKMFWDYLNKLNVPFADHCCTDASDSTSPVRFNATTSSLERFNGTDWVAADDSVTAIQTGLTALASGGQTGATALTPGYNEVTVVATAGDSVKLPTAATGTTVIVKNDGVASMNIFPFLADTINDGSANAAVSLAPGATATFVAVDTTNWEGSNQVLSTNTISEQTVASGVTVDGALIKDGGISANSMFAGFFPTTATQALSGAGAVNITAYLTKFTSTGAAQALTLAAGSQIGQRKKVSHVVDGGSGVMTATYVGGTTITFTTVGEFADLLWTGAAWAVLELGNSATPGTPPALA